MITTMDSTGMVTTTKALTQASNLSTLMLLKLNLAKRQLKLQTLHTNCMLCHLQLSHKHKLLLNHHHQSLNQFIFHQSLLLLLQQSLDQSTLHQLWPPIYLVTSTKQLELQIMKKFIISLTIWRNSLSKKLKA